MALDIEFGEAKQLFTNFVFLSQMIEEQPQIPIDARCKAASFEAVLPPSPWKDLPWGGHGIAQSK